MFGFGWGWIPNPLDIATAPFRWGFNQLKSAGTDLIREAFQWLVGLLLSGVAWLFGVVWKAIAEATTPDLYATWFTNGPYAIVRTLAGALLMLAVMLAIAETVWNRNGGALLRTIAQDFPKAAFLLSALLFITTLGLGFADAVSGWFMSLFNDGSTNFANAMAGATGELQFGAGLIVVMLTAVFMMIILVVLAVAMVFREGFIFILVCLTAVMIAVDVYRPTKGAAGQALRTLAGVIVAKPIIALCFALGGAMLGNVAPPANAGDIPEPGTVVVAGTDPGDPAVQEVIGEDADDLGGTLGVLLAGMATMMLAVVAPITVLRLVPGVSSGAAQEAQAETGAKTVAAAQKAAAVVSAL